jgi:23S rRNA pseudouridine2457 synthase
VASPIILLNKPFGVLSQFTDEAGRPTLAALLHAPGFRPAGRLDADSEGLLVLCDDGVLQARIASPRHKLTKTYLVQVEGSIDEAATGKLCSGVMLNDGPARAVSARCIPPPVLWARQPPVRFRAKIPTSWMEIVLDEGRNRQVRRMTAAAGFPTLRLVRWRVGPWCVEGLGPGESRRMSVTADALREASRVAPPKGHNGRP